MQEVVQSSSDLLARGHTRKLYPFPKFLSRNQTRSKSEMLSWKLPIRFHLWDLLQRVQLQEVLIRWGYNIKNKDWKRRWNHTIQKAWSNSLCWSYGRRDHSQKSRTRLHLWRQRYHCCKSLKIQDEDWTLVRSIRFHRRLENSICNMAFWTNRWIRKRLINCGSFWWKDMGSQFYFVGW